MNLSLEQYVKFTDDSDYRGSIYYYIPLNDNYDEIIAMDKDLKTPPNYLFNASSDYGIDFTETIPEYEVDILQKRTYDNIKLFGKLHWTDRIDEEILKCCKHDKVYKIMESQCLKSFFEPSQEITPSSYVVFNYTIQKKIIRYSVQYNGNEKELTNLLEDISELAYYPNDRFNMCLDKILNEPIDNKYVVNGTFNYSKMIQEEIVEKRWCYVNDALSIGGIEKFFEEITL